MKKVLKALLTAFLVVAVICGAVCIWQWKNIKSIIVGFEAGSTEIEKKRNENQTELVGDISAYMDAPIREMTEEEISQIESGEVTTADVYQKIFEEKHSEDKAEEKPQKNQEVKPTKDQIISKYMAELYGLQNEYTALAETTVQNGVDYYLSLRYSSVGKNEARASAIAKFTPVVRKIQNDCDTKVEAVVKKLENELKSIGADTSIIKSVRNTYQNEKQLKLSHYASKYLK